MHIRVTSQLAVSVLLVVCPAALIAQAPNGAGMIHALDAENQSRYEHVLSFTDIEHYVVFRGDDQVHPAAQMTVRMTYKKGIGKNYQILSQAGSGLIMKYGLSPLLENEKAINDPARAAQSWFTSANYSMKLKAGVTQNINGRPCLAMAIAPLHKGPNMIDGILWIDARDHTLVEVEGIASQKPSVFAGKTHMMRQYVNMRGYAMATHARAESNSMLFGRTVIAIDYSDYHFQISGHP